MVKNTHLYKKFRANKKLNNRKDFPSIVMIQTVTMCNADCVCCPYPYLKNDGRLNQGIMSKELFDKILNEIKLYDVKRVSPYLNNEPFIDKNLPTRLEQIAYEIPNAELHISTNASLLTNDKFKSVANSLTKLHLSTQGGLTNEVKYKENMPGINYLNTKNNIEKFLELIKNGDFRLKPENVTINNVIDFDSEEDFKIEMDYWKEFRVKTNIGGFNSYSGVVSGENFVRRKKSSNKIYGCADKDRPLQAMQILYDGKCALCCNDWTREIVLGNVNDSTLKEVWNSEQYLNEAKIIYSCSEVKNHMCSKCDLALR